MVLLSSGAFIGPEMVLGYLISNNKSRYGFRLFYILFICFLRHLPKKGAQNHFWAPKTRLKPFWAIGPPNIKKSAQFDNPACMQKKNLKRWIFCLETVLGIKLNFKDMICFF